jgi:heme-degrading monooxygenase HmoA
MIIQLVKFKSGLPDGEVRQMMQDRLSFFESLPGLLQKYYIHDAATGEYGGVYVWDSEESMNQFRKSDLAQAIPTRYKVIGQPRVEVFELVLPLRKVN